MTVSFATAYGNTRLTALGQALSGGTLVLLTSGDVEVATLTLSSSGSSAFASVTGKVGTFDDMTQDDSATGGVVAKFEMKNSSGTTIYTGTVTATGGGGDITIPSTTIPAGGIVDMGATAITFTEP